MDRKLQALVKLDVVSDVVRIDVQGNLTQDSRSALVHVIRRIRRMGIKSHIRVDLFRAMHVESAALAGLRNDLNAIDGGATGVSLELIQRGLDSHQDSDNDAQALEVTGEFLASIDPSGSHPLAKYSDDELLAASDSVFGMLDDPAAVTGSELLAQYEAIGMEIERRQSSPSERESERKSLIE
ncbi:HAD family hydrolase [Arthrobacter sp. R4-81]